MNRRTFSRRSFFGLLGAAPLAAPAGMRPVAEPAIVAPTVDTSALDELVRRATAAKRVVADLTTRTGDA